MKPSEITKPGWYIADRNGSEAAVEVRTAGDIGAAEIVYSDGSTMMLRRADESWDFRPFVLSLDGWRKIDREFTEGPAIWRHPETGYRETLSLPRHVLAYIRQRSDEGLAL